MAEAIVTISGNITADPELRFTPSGVAAGDFTVASTPRQYDKQSGEWVDGDTTFLRVNVWRELAEGAVENLRRGDAVLVTGKLKQRSFETREGEKRTVFELEADQVGKSVRVRKSGGGQQQQRFAAANEEAPF